MCLLVFAWRVHPDFPLILAGNRDEFHNRPSAPAEWWDDPSGILAGRDLEAGGTWLGVRRDGRFAVVTNYREVGAPTRKGRSRGELVSGFLSSGESVLEWADDLGPRSEDYAGFNLVIGDEEQVHCLTNRGPDRRFLEPGAYGLSNHLLDTAWPKVVSVRSGLERALHEGRTRPRQLLDLLADRSTYPDEALPDTGVPVEWERALSAAFIVGSEYGTRASTVLLRSAGGRFEFTELRFGPGGAPLGESSFVF